MSGHSKWATIKHKKAATDAKRGRVFTRLIKEITIAARNGGDPGANPRLRAAITAAKAASMPQDNIKRAIQRGTGELEGATLDEVTFEGYGPGGAAMLVQVVTDNRNRTVAEIRHLFSKNGGNLAEQGAVSWMFDRKSHVLIEQNKATEDDLMGILLDAGIDDIKNDGVQWEVIAPPDKHDAVVAALESASIPASTIEVSMIPQNYVKLEGKNASGMLKLSDALEDHEDVQNVYSNFDIDEAELERLTA